MVRLIWTKQTRLDLKSINDYISRDSVKYAQITIEKIIYEVKRLEIFPLSGRDVPETNNTAIREIIYGFYRIVYFIEEETISILTVHHSSRPFDLSLPGN